MQIFGGMNEWSRTRVDRYFFIELNDTPSEINDWLGIYILQTYNIDYSYPDIDRWSYFFNSSSPFINIFSECIVSTCTTICFSSGKDVRRTLLFLTPRCRWGWIRSAESSVKYYPNWQDGGFDINNVLVVCCFKSNKCNRR